MFQREMCETGRPLTSGIAVHCGKKVQSKYEEVNTEQQPRRLRKSGQGSWQYDRHFRRRIGYTIGKLFGESRTNLTAVPNGFDIPHSRPDGVYSKQIDEDLRRLFEER